MGERGRGRGGVWTGKEGRGREEKEGSRRDGEEDKRVRGER